MNPLEYIKNALTNASNPDKFRLGMTSATTPVLTSALYDLKRSNVLPENVRKYVPTFGDDAKMDALMSIKDRMARGENIGEAERVLMDKYTQNNLNNLAMEGTSNLKFDGGVVKRAMSKIDPLIDEAKKYKSAEEFVENQKSVYHETSPETLSMIDNDFQNLNMRDSFVSTDKDFALGQGGKGIILEIDPTKVNLVEARNKAGTGLMRAVTGTNPERVITNNVDANKSVRSILIKPETKIFPLLQKKLDNKWVAGETLEDGSKRYYNKNIYTQLTDIWNKATGGIK